MELAGRLTPSSELAGGVSRRVFKDAVRSWLADGVVDRPKAGFAVPLGAWLRGLRSLPEDVLLDPSALGRGWFRPARMRPLIDEHRSGDAGSRSDALWALIQLELWLQTYVDPAVSAPVSLHAVPVPSKARSQSRSSG